MTDGKHLALEPRKKLGSGFKSKVLGQKILRTYFPDKSESDCAAVCKTK